MYNTGNAGFLTAACNPNRIIDTILTMSIDGSNVSFDTNSIVTYKIVDRSVAGKSFTPGSFVAKQLELSLNEASTDVQKIDFKNSTIGNLVLGTSIKVVRDMIEVPMGIFHLVKDGISTKDEGYIKITATDIPDVLTTQFESSSLELPCTISQALNTISELTGVRISAVSFVNLGITLSETFALTATYREALMYIAEALGAYVCMGRDGEICFKRMFSGLVDIGCTLDDNYLFSVNKQESSVKPFQFIGIKANKDDLGVTYEVEGVTTNCRYDIIDNPLTYGHPEDFLQGIAIDTEFTEFYPSKLSFQGRPDLDTGDVLTYVYKNTTYLFPICSHEFEYNGGFKSTLESIGSDTLNTSSVDSGLKSQVTAIRQNINNLVRDLTQTQSEIIEINGKITQISDITQTVEALTSQISRIEGDVTQLSTLTQTADQLRIDIQTLVEGLRTTNDTVNVNQNTLLSYFDFQADGLTIGVNSSNIKLKLANNKIYFIKDDDVENPVAYFSEGQLYVTDAHFLNSLILGNFEFIPRKNGNLSLRKRG